MEINKVDKVFAAIKPTAVEKNDEKKDELNIKHGTDVVNVDLSKAEEQRKADFINFIKSLVTKQGETSNLKLFGKDLYVSPEHSKEAAASVADGGEYSAKSVANRIFDMAKCFAGDNPEKIKQMRGAVEEGFKQAGIEFGREMPQITRDTYNEIMRRFDEWEKQ